MGLRCVGARRSSRPRLPHRGGVWRRAWPPAAQSPRARRGEASRARDSRRAAATGMTADRFPDVSARLLVAPTRRRVDPERAASLQVDPRSIRPRPRGVASPAGPARSDFVGMPPHVLAGAIAQVRTLAIGVIVNLALALGELRGSRRQPALAVKMAVVVDHALGRS